MHFAEVVKLAGRGRLNPRTEKPRTLNTKPYILKPRWHALRRRAYSCGSSTGAPLWLQQLLLKEVLEAPPTAPWPSAVAGARCGTRVSTHMSCTRGVAGPALLSRSTPSWAPCAPSPQPEAPRRLGLWPCLAPLATPQGPCTPALPPHTPLLDHSLSGSPTLGARVALAHLPTSPCCLPPLHSVPSGAVCGKHEGIGATASGCAQCVRPPTPTPTRSCSRRGSALPLALRLSPGGRWRGPVRGARLLPMTLLLPPLVALIPPPRPPSCSAPAPCAWGRGDGLQESPYPAMRALRPLLLLPVLGLKEVEGSHGAVGPSAAARHSSIHGASFEGYFKGLSTEG